MRVKRADPRRPFDLPGASSLAFFAFDFFPFVAPRGMGPREIDLEAALGAYFLALEGGDCPDALDVAKGDVDLAQRLERLLLQDALAAAVIGGGEPSDLPDEDLAPNLTDRYRILGMIGRGGMGRVFRAERISDGAPVALKVVDLETKDPRAAVRFRREGEITAALRHPNIVSILEVGESGPFGFLAMELLEGPTLEALAGSLAPKNVAEVGIAIAGALEEAHRVGVVHRDVKPANVMFHEGRPVLLDFGLSRAGRHVTITQEDLRPGTLAYLPPECLKRRAPRPDPTMDVYSLGATLYEVLAGRPPFEGSDAPELIRRIVAEDPPRLLGVPRDLETVVFRALEKRPRARFQSAELLARELSRVVEGKRIASRRPGPLVRLGRRALRHPVALGLALALLITLATGAAFWWVQHWKDTEVLRIRIKEIERALSGRDVVRAIVLRDALRRERGVRELEPLFERVDALEALERLLDLILDRSLDQERGVMRYWTERLAKSDALRFHPKEARLAQVFARYAMGDVEGARRELSLARKERVPPGLLHAIGAVLDEDRSVVVPPLEEASAEDHVFLALAFRWLERMTDEEREIKEALAIDDAHYRALYLRALLRFRQGRIEDAWNLATALRRKERPHPSLVTYSVWLALSRGDLDEAARRLESLPRDQLSARGRLLEIDLFVRRSGDGESAWRLAREAVKEYPEDAQVLIYVSGLAARCSRLDAAVALLDRTEHLVVSSSERASIRLRRLGLQLAACHAAFEKDGLGESAAATLESVSAALKELSRGPHHPHIQARAFAGLGEATELRAKATGEPDDLKVALRHFDRAVRRAPDVSELKIRLVRFIHNHDVRSSFDQARRLLAEVLRNPKGGGQASLSSEESMMLESLRSAFSQ